MHRYCQAAEYWVVVYLTVLVFEGESCSIAWFIT